MTPHTAAGTLPDIERRIACVIPAYNAAGTIATTLDSLIAQTMPDWHAVIIDDGSTDDTASVAEHYCTNDRRFTLIHQTNAGVAAARNTGLACARGTFIHQLDADDWLPPNSYADMLKAERPGIDGIAGAFDVTNADHQTIYRHTLARSSITGAELLNGVQVWTGAHILRSTAVRGMRFDTSLTRYEDLDFWLRAAADRGVVWSTTPELVAYHRVTPGSLTSNGAATLRDGARVLTEHLEGDTLHAATAKLALSYATSDVLAGADFDAAIASVRSCARGDGIDPDSAAECARFAAIYRLGIDPTRSHGPWITRTRAWWRHLAEAGLASTSLPRDAMRSLARAIIDPRRVARVLLAGIDPDRGMTIVGLGTNGRVLADEAIRIGMPFDVRDDRGSSVLSAALGGTVRVDPVDAPVSRCETLIITPLDDDGIVARFPASVNARRWNHAVDSLMSTRTDPAFTGAA